MNLEPPHLVAKTYPGHPMSIALAIMLVYDNFIDAYEVNENSVPHAVANIEIPGAGGPVSATLRLLRDYMKGETFGWFVAECEATWVKFTEGAFHNRREAGTAEAKRNARHVQNLLATKEGWRR
jgi:hypothetical protein